MKEKVLVTLGAQLHFIPEMKEYLQEKGFEIKQADISRLGEEDLARQAGDCTAVIAGAESWTGSMFEQLPNLKCIMKSGAGLDAIDIETATRCGVVIANTPGQNSHAVADMAACMILSVLRQNLKYDSVVRDKRWSEMRGKAKLCHELSALTVGLLGFGAIARRVAEILSGFGCRFIAYDVKPDQEAAERLHVELVSFEEVIRQSDILSLHVPLTEETRNCINAETLAMMKSTAMIVNTCRGGVICEKDLYEALKNGVIQAAALDVFTIEPIEDDNPLLTLDNIQFTPHMATATFEAMENMYMACARQTVQFFRGENVPYIVNPDYVKYL